MPEVSGAGRSAATAGYRHGACRRALDRPVGLKNGVEGAERTRGLHSSGVALNVSIRAGARSGM